MRNPWDRHVSLYEGCINTPPPFGMEHVRKYLRQYHRCDKITFEQFTQYVNSDPDYYCDDHWRSQYLFVYNEENNRVVDFLGRFENLPYDFEKVCNTIGIKAKLSHKNKSKRASFKNYYNEFTKTIIAQRYSRDIKLFNYDFN